MKNKTLFVDLLVSLRIQHWAKNLLIFIPLFLSDNPVTLQDLYMLAKVFLIFSIIASAGYIINDVKDIESDKLHPQKKFRAVASDAISPKFALFVAAFLVITSIYFAKNISLELVFLILTYLFLNLIYTIFLKRVYLVDCLTLSSLHTLRLVIGSFVLSEIPSFWLVLFSIFFFLSLAFSKRFYEIKMNGNSDNSYQLPGRGYISSDKNFLFISGLSSGYSALLILALYLNSNKIIIMYAYPLFFWPLLFIGWLWINLIWLKANRGEFMHDPLVFAYKDKYSLSLILAGLITFFFAKGLFFGN